MECNGGPVNAFVSSGMGVGTASLLKNVLTPPHLPQSPAPPDILPITLELFPVQSEDDLFCQKLIVG
jgi:hypothetical protein